MVVPAVAQSGLSPSEYLAYERSSGDKHEYLGGELFAMAGGSHEHNLIVANLLVTLHQALLDRPCLVYPSDMRLKVTATGLYAYPDVSVVCGGPSFEDERRDTLLNPVALCEVLSDSTEAYDRGKKFENYRQLSSLDHVLLLSQHEPLIEHFQRAPDNKWILHEHRPGSKVTLIDCTISVDTIYCKVFDPLPPT